MRQTKRLAAIGSVIAFVLAGLALGDAAQCQAQSIEATNAWARRAPAMGSMKMDKMDKMDKMNKMGGGGNGAVYVTLTNSGAQADSLVSVSTEAAQTAELHQVKNDGGVMKMRPVQAIPVPAHGKTELKPGGYHIMLMGLQHDLKAGEKIPVTLKFEHAGEVRVEASVK